MDRKKRKVLFNPKKRKKLMDRKKLKKIMKKTCDLASKGIDLGSGPFAAIITDVKGNIKAEGNNMVTKNNDPTQHAEIVAIRNACSALKTYNLQGYTLFSSCEPCPMCLCAIYWSRINVVYYGNNREDAKKIGFDDSFFYDEISKDNKDRSIQMKQISNKHTIEHFDKWEHTKKKRKY